LEKLGLRGSAGLDDERLLENLLLRADQMANAMMVRGFTSQMSIHWHQLRLKKETGLLWQV